MSVFHTYAAAHAKTSDDMAKRAETRAQEAKLAVTEAEADEKKAAEQQAAMVAAASVNTGTKRPASTAGGKTKKPALADQVAAAGAAHPENVAKQAKAKPTKLEKDIAKEIKLLKTTRGGDKTQDYTVRRCVQRIEALVEKDEANAVEALVAQGGIEAIIKACDRIYRSLSRSDDLGYLAEAARGIFQLIAQVNANHILEESRFALLWADYSKRKRNCTWYKIMTELASNEMFLEQERFDLVFDDLKTNKNKSAFFELVMKTNSAVSKAFLERITSDDILCFVTHTFMKADPIDEPEFDYVDGVEHIAVIKLLSLIGGSSVGLAKMKAIGSAIEKYVVAHEKTFTSKRNKCRWTGYHWGSCEDSCDAKAQHVLKLLRGKY